MLTIERESDGIVVHANRNRLGVGLVLFGTLLYFYDIVTTLPLPGRGGLRGDAGPALHPWLITFTILICGLWILRTSSGIERIKVSYQMLGKSFAFIVLSVIYSILIFLIGFFASSILYGLSVILLFNYPDNHLKTAIPIAVLIALAVFGIFEFAFDVRLPTIF